MKNRRIPVIAKWWLALASVFALLLLGLGYGAEWPAPPSGQPVQIRSQVKYDPKLSDRFFESEEWSYPYWIIKRPDGSVVNPRGGPTDEKDLRLKHTARCASSFQYEHFINFCDARLLDGGTIELFIHEASPAVDDYLRIVLQNGVFWSQYWTYYKHLQSNSGLTWTTREQELTLDRQVYHKGDVIKGRIVFECVQEVTNPPYIARYPKIIKVEGVFKTILE